MHNDLSYVTLVWFAGYTCLSNKETHGGSRDSQGNTEKTDVDEGNFYFSNVYLINNIYTLYHVVRGYVDKKIIRPTIGIFVSCFPVAKEVGIQRRACSGAKVGSFKHGADNDSDQEENHIAVGDYSLFEMRVTGVHPKVHISMNI